MTSIHHKSNAFSNAYKGASGASGITQQPRTSAPAPASSFSGTSFTASPNALKPTTGTGYAKPTGNPLFGGMQTPDIGANRNAVTATTGQRLNRLG